MINLGNLFALREVWQLLKGIVPDSTKDEPLTQQKPSNLIPSYDDEAIAAALDTALYTLKGVEGAAYLGWIEQVRAELLPHQRERWRKVYGNIVLTERHENRVCSEKTNRVEASAKGPARDESSKEYKREAKDYEYTLEDPRLQHLVVVAEMVRDHGVAKAKRYLLESDFVLEKSLFEQGKGELGSLKDSGMEKLSRASYSLFLGKEYEEICAWNAGAPFEEVEKLLKEALVAKTARRKRRLEVAKKTRIFHARPFALSLLVLATIVMILATAYLELY